MTCAYKLWQAPAGTQVHDYTSVVIAFSRKHYWERACDVLTEMHSRGLDSERPRRLQPKKLDKTSEEAVKFCRQSGSKAGGLQQRHECLLKQGELAAAAPPPPRDATLG